MPDRYGRKPIGTLTRHPADFYSGYLYTAGHAELDQPVGPGEIYFAVGLFNADQDGRVMKVYGATSLSEGGGGCQIFMPLGAMGVAIDVARSIRPDRAGPNVEVSYQFTQVPNGNPNPFNFGAQFGVISASGFDSNTVLSPFPLFIVPQGYSLIATNPSSSFANGFFAWFQMAAQ